MLPCTVVLPQYYSKPRPDRHNASAHNEHMASSSEYGSVLIGDVHAEFVSSGSTQTRRSMGKVFGAALVVRQQVPNYSVFLGDAELTALWRRHVRRGS